MQASLRLLAGAGALLLATLTTSAQVFVGSDNFNDNTLTAQITDNVNSGIPQAAGQYRFVNNNTNGTGNLWTETNQRMEFTTTNTAAFNRGQLGWASPTSSGNATGSAGLSSTTPYVSSWTAQVSVTNNLTSFTSGGFAAAGFEIYTTNATNSGSNAYYGINLNNAQAGQFVDLEWGTWNGTGFTAHQTFLAIDDTSDILLRMTYDGASKVLVTDYSKDGGATYLTGATWDLDGAEVGISAPGINSVGLEFYAAAAQGYAVNSGDITFDNFSVTAIPEPSTYAAIAGACGLGLAAWHRRRKVAA